jgi:hypothetical protein
VILDIGVRVKLVGQGDKVYHVGSVEEHDGLVFYRLRELRGALFLASSLESV